MSSRIRSAGLDRCAGAVSIKASPINGVGVFAETGFEAGDVVLTIDDSHRVDEGHPVPAGEEHYCDFLGGGQVIWMQVPERHINHSCEPNVFVDSENGIRRVVAMREVQPGDEITYDYCINGFGDVVWQCHCGSQRCRREVHSDFFHLPIELQAEYLPYLNDWFRFERADEVKELERKMVELRYRLTI